MSEKDFHATFDSDARRSPVRVAFVTRRTSPAVNASSEKRVMTYPETLLRAAVAVEAVAIALVILALLWDAPLEQLADPMHTPNPAKAPWYFLGLQELLHYFPPVVAGVIIPGLVVMALIVIPYFNINVEAEGIWRRDRQRRLRIAGIAFAALIVFFTVYDVYVALVPTLVVCIPMFLAARFTSAGAGVRGWLASKPLSFWIMTWFLGQLLTLTMVGTFFRGPGWSWVWPWRS